MTTYRVYLLDGRSQITWGEWLDVETEDEAMSFARGRCAPGIAAVELWRKAERIWRMDCPELEVPAQP